MFEGISLTQNMSFIIVFVEGLLSFFSPCVIPIIPIYISYLSGNTAHTQEDGTVIYPKKKLFFHTLFFILGISFAFFILGMSFTALGTFFQDRRILFTRIGGILIVFLGLFQVGFLDLKFLQRERKLPVKLNLKKVNPLVAFIMGFTFSFAWTPCVGPALSSVLIMASSAKDTFTGNMLVFVYAIGFVIPFLLLGLFTTQVLNFLKEHKSFMKYTVKLGGILLIIIGTMTFTGWMNTLSGYLNTYTPSTSLENTEAKSPKEEPSEMPDDPSSNLSSDAPSLMPAFDFTLVDQYGKEHTLSDYKGQVVFLNFWATWCPPCKAEMPHIEELYNTYNQNSDEVVILGIANPKSIDFPHNQDVSKEEIATFLKDNGYTFPTVFDETGDIFSHYRISAFPTTFMIDKKGNIYGYVPGMLSRDMMISIIDQTLKAGD